MQQACRHALCGWVCNRCVMHGCVVVCLFTLHAVCVDQDCVLIILPALLLSVWDCVVCWYTSAAAPQFLHAMATTHVERPTRCIKSGHLEKNVFASCLTAWLLLFWYGMVKSVAIHHVLAQTLAAYCNAWWCCYVYAADGVPTVGL